MPSPTPSSRAPFAGLVILVAFSAPALALPVAGLAVDLVRGLSSPTHAEWWWIPAASLARTAGWASLIGLLAALLGLPIAWACRRVGSLLAACLLAPALIPAFLAYSGWGMIRAPLSTTGAWIDAQRQAGWDWLPHTVDTILAVAGLALWAAPIAAACMLPGVRALTDDLLDAVRLEARPLRSLRLILPALASPFLFAAAAIAALMLGSAIPLHLARIDTAAIVLWAQLDLTPPDRHWQVWIAGWPLLAAAVALAWAAARLGRRPGATSLGAPLPSRRATPRPVGLLALAVVSVGSLVPLALFGTQLRSPSAVPRYWHDHRDAVVASAGLALGVGAACALLAAAAWHAASTTPAARRPARLLGLLAAAWTAAGLLPGVMTGAAVARGFSLLASLLPDALDPSDSVLPIAAAHLARLGFLPIWAGLWLAASEPSDARDHRRLDGAESLAGWIPGTLAAHAGILAGLAAACAALSLHEIEASVLTLWPGGALLARQLLNDLHFFRTQDLAAGVVLLACLLAPAAVALALALRRWGRGVDGGARAGPGE